ncbi:MAG: hypothetical protein WDN25_04085 [Acetobacteraceae bacterium]
MSLAITVRQRFMLAVLAAAGAGKIFTPLRIQWLFYRVYSEAARHPDLREIVPAPPFQFIVYPYGPLDVAVYDDLDRLQQVDLITLTFERYQTYALNAAGWKTGSAALAEQDTELRSFLVGCSSWALALDVHTFVTVMFNQFPELVPVGK